MAQPGTLMELENAPVEAVPPPRGSGRRLQRITVVVFAALLLALPTVTLPAQGFWLGVKTMALEAGAIVLAVMVFSRGDWTLRRARAAATAPVNLLALLLLTWVGISLLVSTVPSVSQQEAVRYLGGGLLYFAALYGISARRHLSLVAALLGLAASLATMAAFLNAGETDSERVSGAFHNQQLLAGFLCLLFPMVVIASQQDPDDWRRIGLQVASVITGAGILVTQNRSVWFGSAVALLLLGLLYFLYGRKQGGALQRHQVIIPVVMVALVVGLFLVMSRMSGSLSQRANTLSSLERDQSFQWRLGMWSKAVRMTRDRPLLGWGIGSFPLIQALYFHPDAPSRSQRSILRSGPTLQENAHNSYLQLAAEIGIPGLLLYLGFLSAFFITGFRALPHLDPGPRQGILMGALAGVAGQMVSAVGNPSWEFPECSAFFWLTLAIGMVAAGVGARGGPTSAGARERKQFLG